MSKYLEVLKTDRRLCILRLLTEINGSANESVLKTGLEALGHVRLSRDDIRDDLKFLIDKGCLIDQWYDSVQVVTITRRGVETAEGIIVIEGIKQPSIGV